VKNFEIRDRLAALVREERRATREILDLLLAAMEGRAWLEFGFSSLFDWLTRGFGYSPTAAMRRIEAARLLRVVPEAEALSLGAMAQVQSAIRAQEKAGPVSAEQKKEAVRAVEGISAREAEKRLIALFPASGERAKREVHRVTKDGSVRHSFNLNEKATADLKRTKEVLSHKFPNATDAEVIAYALEFLLERKDPLRQPASNCHDAASAAEPTNLVKRTRQVLQKYGGECSFVDPHTGVKCTSRYQIQIDHIHPKALGGTNQAENLRALCRQHNLYEAERVFGRSKVPRRI
jgi:hypothetical protein